MSTTRRRTFVPAGAAPVTPPNADERVPQQAAPTQTSGRRDVKTPPPTEEARLAFTWRLLPSEHASVEELLLRLRRETHLPKLTKADMLTALVDLAENNPAVFGALIGRLQDVQTSR